MADVTDGVLFLVPARGGSQRLPGKNLRTVAGIPLVGHAVRAARSAAAVVPDGPHQVVCSTDDPAIAAAALRWGGSVPFERPSQLATADATAVDVALHALSAFEASGVRFRAIVLVQPTSPLSHASDIRSAVERFDRAGGRPVVSVTAAHPAAWHQAIRDDDSIVGVEVADAKHILTGAFYVIDPAELARTRSFAPPGRTLAAIVAPERSLDVDELADLVAAEAMAAARPVRVFDVGRPIGGPSVFIIAEAGVNHQGDPAMAHRLIDAAADTGADAVKFQTFDPDALVSADAPTAEYQRAAGEAERQGDMLRRLALPLDAWVGLQAHAVDRGIVFLSTPFDDASAALLDGLDVPAFKVGSGELTNLPFLARLARRGRPLLVSTGMADMAEVAGAVDTIAAAGDPAIALFHCVSNYPALPEDANLRAIETLRRAFGVPTGWSDHTPGNELALAATAIGATLIEKHLTLDRDLPGPDHRASLEPTGFAAMVVGIRVVERSLGSGDKVPVAAEGPIAAVARRSLHWERSLEPGALIEPRDLVALRPGTGLPPVRSPDFVGRRTSRAVMAGTQVDLDDIEGLA